MNGEIKINKTIKKEKTESVVNLKQKYVKKILIVSITLIE